jgi:cell division septation protein DedD
MAHRILTGLAVVVLIGGCSTRPREFRAKLATPAPDQPAFERDLQICQVLVRKGVRGNFAQTAAQLGVGAAVGTGVGAAVTTAALSSAGTGISSLGNIAAAPAAGAAAAFIVAPLAIFGVSRVIRSGREKKYKAALGTCLTEYGYTASGWEKQKKISKEDRARIIASLKAAVIAMQAADDAAVPVDPPAPVAAAPAPQPAAATEPAPQAPPASPPAAFD